MEARSIRYAALTTTGKALQLKEQFTTFSAMDKQSPQESIIGQIVEMVAVGVSPIVFDRKRLHLVPGFLVILALAHSEDERIAPS